MVSIFCFCAAIMNEIVIVIYAYEFYFISENVLFYFPSLLLGESLKSTKNSFSNFKDFLSTLQRLLYQSWFLSPIDQRFAWTHHCKHKIFEMGTGDRKIFRKIFRYRIPGRKNLGTFWYWPGITAYRPHFNSWRPLL